MIKHFATVPLKQESESSAIVFLVPDDVENAFDILAIRADRISGESVCIPVTD